MDAIDIWGAGLPMSRAPRDGTIVLLYIPGGVHRTTPRRVSRFDGRFFLAKWCDAPASSGRRKDQLIEKHGGYWTAKLKSGDRPLIGGPARWWPLPDIQDIEEGREAA